MNHRLFVQHKQFLKDCKSTFRAKSGNYYSCLEMPSERKLKYFVREKMPREVFTISASLQSELNKQIDTITEHVGNLKEEQVTYYRIGNLSNELDRVCMIDINSAYARALYNFDLISEPMLEKLLTVKKDYRLAAVGIMASKTMVEDYIEGILVDFFPEVKHPVLRKLFLRLCIEVSICMDFVAKAMGKDFIFYWVDGILINNFTPDKFFQVQEIISDFFFDFKTDFVTVNKIGISNSKFQLNYTNGKAEIKNYSVYCGGRELITKEVPWQLERMEDAPEIIEAPENLAQDLDLFSNPFEN